MIIRKTATKQLLKNMYAGISPTYHGTLRLLAKTEYLPAESLRTWQLRQLKTTLLHAYQNVPFYREAFDQARVNPKEIAELSDIQAYPLLTKETYRDNADRFISRRAKKRLLVRVYTGGTTGVPLPIYRNASDFAREMAFLDYAYRLLKMDPHCRSVHLRGEVDDQRGRYHSVGNFGRTLYLSSNNLSDDNLRLYVELIRDFKPLLLYTLPSVAVVLAEYMERRRLAPFASLRWAFCPSENLYDFQVELIERVLKCRVGTHYGHSEHAVFAGRCTDSTLYHVLPQYGYTELVDAEGKVVTEEGRLGEIVGTAFANRACPFIRYRTGDYAIYTTKKCSCGRNYPMWEKIEGRGQHVAVAKNNSRVSIGPGLLCTLHDTTYGKIKQFEIEQRRVGELIVRVVPLRADDLQEVEAYLRRALTERFPNMFDVQVKLMDSAETSRRTQKHRYFVQHLSGIEQFSSV